MLAEPLPLLEYRRCATAVALRTTEYETGPMSLDPVMSNPDHYKVVFENDLVRVLEYTDVPGDKTTPHEHPDSVMYTLGNSVDGCTPAIRTGTLTCLPG